MGFSIVFSNVAMMLLYLICGYLLVKSGKAEASHAKSISGFLIYVCGPCMVVSAFQTLKYSAELTWKIGKFFLATLVVQGLFLLILFLLFGKKYEDAKYRILCAGAIFGNVGFFGLPLVTSLFPNEPVVACYSSAYVMSMNLLVFTVGVFLITKDKKFISFKSALLNPTSIAIFVALPLYFTGFYFPDTLGNGISLLGKMTTPICMLVLGMRLASAKLSVIFKRPFAYAVCFLKLVAFPVFAFLCVNFLPFFDHTFKVCVLVLSAAPSAAVILSIAELHECEQELTANVVLLTTLFSLVTVPLLLLLA